MKLAGLLALMSLFSLALCLIRISVTESSLYFFLNWNLFLAAIPFALTTVLMRVPPLRHKRWTLLPILAAWLLFFPNAPYILTDIFHLRYSTAAPQWFDLTLVLSYAWTGLLFGLLSLMDVEQMLKERMSHRLVNTLVGGLLFLSSFGIYLGRFLRLNSWEILSNPFGLFREIALAVLRPQDMTAMGMTLLMGTLLTFIYWSVKMLGPQHSE